MRLTEPFWRPGWRPSPETQSWSTNLSPIWRDSGSWSTAAVWRQCRSTRRSWRKSRSKVLLWFVLWRCVIERVAHGYGISLVQPKVPGNGEELILKSPACKSMPSPSSSTKKSLGLCTKRCPPTPQRETSKQPEGLRSLDVFQKVYLHVCFPQVQPNMQGEDRSLRRRLGFAGRRPPLTGSLRARLRKLGFDQDWSWPQIGWQGTWFT